MTIHAILKYTKLNFIVLKLMQHTISLKSENIVLSLISMLTICESRGGGGGGGGGQGVLTKPAFNVGPSSARQPNAI